MTLNSDPNCQLRGAGNVQGQIFENIFLPQMDRGYSVYYPLNIFRTLFLAGNTYMQSRDAFRPTARERKHLMDIKRRSANENNIQELRLSESHKPSAKLPFNVSLLVSFKQCQVANNHIYFRLHKYA